MQNFNLDTTTFLRDYWQQKPLLIKNPWPIWKNPIAPDELAGLACEELVESRLIMRAGNSWNLEQGPFPAKRFGALGKEACTLLVQAVDHHVPEVAALIEPFRFIPNWRIDDVMVSFASDGGGVGPHFDHYDVFLVQGLGKRRWQVGGMCDENSKLLPNDDLRLLANFQATDEWLLEPGDMLYVPPGISHNGVAVGDDCMTYSIGFRAPSRSELIGYWADDLLADMPDDDRYGDAGLQPQDNPGEISPQAIDRLHAMITEKLADREAFVRWFGQYNSTPKYPDVDWRPEVPIEVEQLRKALTSGIRLRRNPASRFSFVRENENWVILFVDGQSFHCNDETISFAKDICARDTVTIDQDSIQSDAAMRLIVALYNQGSLASENAAE